MKHQDQQNLDSINARIEACILKFGPIDPTQIRKKLGLPIQQKIYSHLASLVRQKRIINLYAGTEQVPRYVTTNDMRFAEKVDRISSITPPRRPEISGSYTSKNWRHTTRSGALDHEKHGSLRQAGEILPFCAPISMGIGMRDPGHGRERNIDGRFSK